MFPTGRVACPCFHKMNSRASFDKSLSSIESLEQADKRNASTTPPSETTFFGHIVDKAPEFSSLVKDAMSEEARIDEWAMRCSTVKSLLIFGAS